MDDVANIRFVHAEPEGIGGDHDHLASGRHEGRLRLFPLVRGHLAVVALDRDLAVAQSHVELVDRPDRRAIHDARPPQPLDQLAQDAQLVRLAADLAHVEGQVGSVERHPAGVDVLHPELDRDVLGDCRRGGGGEAQDAEGLGPDEIGPVRGGEAQDGRPPQHLRRTP